MFYWHLILDRSTAFVDAVSKTHPDVGVVDIVMPVMNGIGATAEINSCGSSMKMIFLTVNKDPDFVGAAFEAGASGYVIKRQMASDLPHGSKESTGWLAAHLSRPVATGLRTLNNKIDVAAFKPPIRMPRLPTSKAYIQHARNPNQSDR